MEDTAIINLFWQRSEDAIAAASEKYGAYCHTIAYNILQSTEDADEVSNDTYYAVWNNIPTDRPNIFKSYIGKIARNFAINLYSKAKAEKRGGGQVPLILHELEEIATVQAAENAADIVIEQKAIASAINRYLQGISQEKRVVFVLRYFYCENITEIAKRTNKGESAIKQMLFRCRDELKKQLYEEGVSI